MPTLEDLLSRREQLREELAKLEFEIQVVQVARRNEGIARIKGLMAQFELTTADLLAPSSSRQLALTSMPSDERPTVKPKFRDPISGKTWSARGLKPRWLADAIARGKTLEDFAIHI